MGRRSRQLGFEGTVWDSQASNTHRVKWTSTYVRADGAMVTRTEYEGVSPEPPAKKRKSQTAVAGKRVEEAKKKKELTS